MPKISDWINRYVFAGRPSATDNSYANEVVVDDQGNLAVKVMGRNVSLPAYSDLGQTLNVSPGGRLIISVTPPSGQLWHVRLLGFYFPGIPGSTGNHQVEVWYGTSSVSETMVLQAINTGTSSVGMKGNVITSASTKFPSTDEAQQNAILNLVLSNQVPMHIIYTNNTNLAQTGRCYIPFIKEVEPIAA